MSNSLIVRYSVASGDISQPFFNEGPELQFRDKVSDGNLIGKGLDHL